MTVTSASALTQLFLLMTQLNAGEDDEFTHFIDWCPPG